jgi:hypothetical protein
MSYYDWDAIKEYHDELKERYEKIWAYTLVK